MTMIKPKGGPVSIPGVVERLGKGTTIPCEVRRPRNADRITDPRQFKLDDVLVSEALRGSEWLQAWVAAA